MHEKFFLSFSPVFNNQNISFTYRNPQIHRSRQEGKTSSRQAIDGDKDKGCKTVIINVTCYRSAACVLLFASPVGWVGHNCITKNGTRRSLRELDSNCFPFGDI